MNKKKWFLLVFIASLFFGYYKLFYKKFNYNAVAQSADYFFVADVKAITNHVLWQVITTPKLWKKGNIYSTKKDSTNWKDMFVLPDYLVGFHVKKQPAYIWYTVQKIDNSKDFAKGLKRYHFETKANNVFISKAKGLLFYKNDNTVLVTNHLANDALLQEVIGELFVKKQFLNKAISTNIIASNNHFTFYTKANNFLQKDASIIANLDAIGLTIKATILPKQQYIFNQMYFTIHSNALSEIAVSQPPLNIINSINDSTKASISKWLNIPFDSLLQPTNTLYHLTINGFKTRIDSALTNTYDDDYNVTQNVVVNKVEEPAFSFTIAGANTYNLFLQWQQNGYIENTSAGKLFTPIPFVKTYIDTAPNLLNISANNYVELGNKKNITGVLYAHILASQIPASIIKFVPSAMLKPIQNIDKCTVYTTLQNQELVTEIIVTKKQNSPFVFTF